MKKIILILACLNFCIAFAFGQQEMEEEVARDFPITGFVTGGLTMSNAQYDGTNIGITFQGNVLYKLPMNLGVGLGVNLDLYNINSYENPYSFLPVYLSAYYLPKKFKHSIFGGINLGYGIPVDLSPNDFTLLTGGVYISPKIGWHIKSKGNSFIFSTGYQFQYATREQWEQEDKLSFKQLVFSMGVWF